METKQLLKFKLVAEKQPTYNVVGNVISAEDVNDILRTIFDENQMIVREFFYVLYLSNSNSVIGYSCLSMGGMVGTVVDIRLLFREALLCGATAIIISHNHPSGKVNPSQADISITRKIKEASKFLDINLLDHLILTESDYYSFANEGIL